MQKQIFFFALSLVCLVSSEWTVKDLRVPRVRPAVAQVDNKVYIAGGEINGGIETDSIEVLNTDSLNFESTEIRLPSPRQRFTALTIGSKIFFSSGTQNNSQIDVFDTSNNMWGVLTVPELSNDYIIYAGVLDDKLVYTTSNVTALFIDPQTGNVITSFQLGNYNGTASILPTRTFLQIPQYNGKLYVAYSNDIISFNATSVCEKIVRPYGGVTTDPNHLLIQEFNGLPYLFVADILVGFHTIYNLTDTTRNGLFSAYTRQDYSYVAAGGIVYYIGGYYKWRNGTLEYYTTTDSAFFDYSRQKIDVKLFIPIKMPRSQMTPFALSTNTTGLVIGGITPDGKYSSTIDIIYNPLTVPSSPATSPTQLPSNVPQGLHVTSGGSRSIFGAVLTTVIIVLVSLFN